MLRASGMKFSAGGSSMGGGGGGRPQAAVGAGADAAGRDGASLSQLENVLQRLNKHDERAQIQRVERTSAQAQHKLLKNELLKAQEELAQSHTGKNKLCEEIGALQQVKHDQKKQIEHLLVELRSSRESQAAMAKKVAELEQCTQDLKTHYTRSLTWRMKTASELLSRLQVVGAIGDTTELSEAIHSKCERWTESEPNKRKRVDEDQQPTVVEDSTVDDDAMEGESPNGILSPIGVANESESVMECEKTAENVISAISTSNPELSDIENAGPESHDECQSCIERALENASLKDAAEKEVEAIKTALQVLEDRNDELHKKEEHARARTLALSQLLDEKEKAIEELRESLESEKDKAMQAEIIHQQSVGAKVDEPSDDSSSRIKVLEDNLAQLNTYADHLEMLISQCVSCSVKLQSENTQASEQ